MRKLFVLATLATITLTAVEAQAAVKRVRTTQVSSTPSAIDRLVDLERRKNAYLRQTFLGR